MISVTQSAVTGFAAGSASRTLTIAKATQSALSVTTSNGVVGQGVSLASSGGTAGATTYSLTDNGGGACTLTGSQLSRSSSGTCTVTATRAGNDNYLPVTSAAKTVSFIPSGSGLLLYEVRNTKRSVSEILYTDGYGTGATHSAATFDAAGNRITRVIYRMEVKVGEVVRYAEVSFDPWTGLTARGLRVPDLLDANKFEVQRFVENMTVDSNMTTELMDVTASAKSHGITNGTGRRGYLEIWPWNYNTGANGVYDHSDSPSINGGGYGSFQVHDAATGATILAWNRHNPGESNGPDIGLGSFRGPHPDWTFSTTGGLGTTDWKLQIRVEWEPTVRDFYAVDCMPVDATGTENQAGIPGGERCENAFESPGAETTENKLYDGSGPFLIWVDLGAHYELSGFQVWTANDVVGRDPTAVKFYASSEARTRVGSPIVDQPVTCPSDRFTACTPITFATTSAQRYLVIEIPSVKSGGEFQISRARFTGKLGVAPTSSASTSSTSAVEEVDESEPPVDESAPPSDEIEPPGEETTDGEPMPDDEESSDDLATDDGESGDDPLIEDAPLIGVLAMGARAATPTTRSAKRKRQHRRI